MNAQHTQQPLCESDKAFFTTKNGEDELHLQLRLPAFGAIRKIMIHFAMEDEALPFINATNAKPYLSSLPMMNANSPSSPKIHAYTKENVEIFIVTNGFDSRFDVAQVGAGPSGTAVLLSALTLEPDLIINAGTAGGFNEKGGSVGDVYLGTGAVFHDHRIPLPNYQEYGRGFYPTLTTPVLQNLLQLKEGLVTTGGSLDCSPEDAAQISLLGATIKDMEAAEVARLAVTLGVPLIIVKAITDLVDLTEAKTHEQFQTNFQFAVSQLTDRLMGIEQFICSEQKPGLELL